MKKIPVVMMVIMALMLSGCSSKPDNDEIETQLRETLTIENLDIFSIENFEKTNGFSKDNNTYVADIEYDFVFKKDFDEIKKLIKQQSDGSIVGDLEKKAQVWDLLIRYGDFEEGYRVRESCQLTMIKTENGWRIMPNDD